MVDNIKIIYWTIIEFFRFIRLDVYPYTCKFIYILPILFVLVGFDDLKSCVNYVPNFFSMHVIEMLCQFITNVYSLHITCIK